MGLIHAIVGNHHCPFYAKVTKKVWIWKGLKVAENLPPTTGTTGPTSSSNPFDSITRVTLVPVMTILYWKFAIFICQHDYIYFAKYIFCILSGRASSKSFIQPDADRVHRGIRWFRNLDRFHHNGGISRGHKVGGKSEKEKKIVQKSCAKFVQVCTHCAFGIVVGSNGTLFEPRTFSSYAFRIRSASWNEPVQIKFAYIDNLHGKFAFANFCTCHLYAAWRRSRCNACACLPSRRDSWAISAVKAARGCRARASRTSSRWWLICPCPLGKCPSIYINNANV